MSRHTPDLTGQRFTRLLALGRVYFPGERDAFWECRCDCGAELPVASYSLRSGNTKSCGCLKTDTARSIHRTHGFTARSGGARRAREYQSWQSAKGRCYNKDVRNFHNYGGRGIYMCDRWLNDFPAFLADMGPRPEGCSLGRINNDGPYAPENCRWETPDQQASNTRNCRFVDIGAGPETLTAAARKFGLHPKLVSCRMSKKGGWKLDDALLAAPGETRHKRLLVNGESKTVQQWADASGIPIGTILGRLNTLGWDAQRAVTEPVREWHRSRQHSSRVGESASDEQGA